MGFFRAFSSVWPPADVFLLSVRSRALGYVRDRAAQPSRVEGRAVLQRAGGADRRGVEVHLRTSALRVRSPTVLTRICRRRSSRRRPR